MYLHSRCGAPAFWVARHTTMCLDNESQISDTHAKKIFENYSGSSNLDL